MLCLENALALVIRIYALYKIFNNGFSCKFLMHHKCKAVKLGYHLVSFQTRVALPRTRLQYKATIQHGHKLYLRKNKLFKDVYVLERLLPLKECKMFL